LLFFCKTQQIFIFAKKAFLDKRCYIKIEKHHKHANSMPLITKVGRVMHDATKRNVTTVMIPEKPITYPKTPHADKVFLCR
jgi:hypothetical protein